MIKCALFVDFDNIYSALRRTADGGADRFAREPGDWLRWMEQNTGNQGGDRRRILVRRVYLNPQVFGSFRAHFLRAGFEVIDCPPLTLQGKTSADIRMVLDLVDTLSHPTRFDEFILCSGDADFTPVLQRLRMHDRRATLLSVGYASAAYKACCDELIEEDRFLEEALGVTGQALQPPPAPRPVAPGDREVLGRIGVRVAELSSMTGRLDPWQLPSIYKEFPEFAGGENWLGFFGLRPMTEAVVETTDAVRLGEDQDEWWVELHAAEETAASAASAASAAEASDLRGSREEIAALVRAEVAASEEPVVLATLAQKVIDRFGDAVRAGGWQGAGSFRDLLQRLDLGPCQIWPRTPGWVYDPARHHFEDGEPVDGFAQSDPELAALARRVSQVTDMPYLKPEDYAMVSELIAREVAENGFFLNTTSKGLRDRANAQGISLARSEASFLLRGLSFSGYDFTAREQSPRTIAHRLADNAVLLGSRAQMDLSEDEAAEIRRWITGAVPPEVEASIATRHGGNGSGNGASRQGASGDGVAGDGVARGGGFADAPAPAPPAAEPAATPRGSAP